MNDTIWLDLADCIGHALAKRWLARRRGSRILAATDPVMNTNPVLEGHLLEGRAAEDSRPQTESTPGE